MSAAGFQVWTSTARVGTEAASLGTRPLVQAVDLSVCSARPRRLWAPWVHSTWSGSGDGWGPGVPRAAGECKLMNGAEIFQPVLPETAPVWDTLECFVTQGGQGGARGTGSAEGAPEPRGLGARCGQWANEGRFGSDRRLRGEGECEGGGNSGGLGTQHSVT